MKPNIKQQTAANNYIRQLILPSDPLSPLWNRENFIFRKQPKWNYIDCLMIGALLGLYDITGDESLVEYSARFMDAYVDECGNIPTLHPEDHNIDNFCGGRVLLRMNTLTSDDRYLRAAEKLFRLLVEEQPRTSSGNFWHKEIYPGQVWLDGVYMAFPFMLAYARLTGNKNAEEDVYSQLENIRIKMRDSASGLYYHGMDESLEAQWADKKTGLSSEFWLRSMGWLSAGLADICGIDGSRCGEMLCGLLDSLSRCITDEGMLLQLPFREGLPGNYPETSGTLLFAYSAMKAARLGIAGDDIKKAGIRAFEAVTGKYIDIGKDVPVLKNICLMAGLGGEPFRDGTADYYLSEQVTENDAKGIAPYLMAYTEFLKA